MKKMFNKVLVIVGVATISLGIASTAMGACSGGQYYTQPVSVFYDTSNVPFLDPSNISKASLNIGTKATTPAGNAFILNGGVSCTQNTTVQVCSSDTAPTFPLNGSVTIAGTNYPFSISAASIYSSPTAITPNAIILTAGGGGPLGTNNCVSAGSFSAGSTPINVFTCYCGI